MIKEEICAKEVEWGSIRYDNTTYGFSNPLTPAEGKISFICGSTEMLSLEVNGDILVKGKIIENDKEVVEALREFLLFQKNNR